MSTPNPVPVVSPFTAQQLVDLRRFLGYPLYGAAPTPMNGYRFYVKYGAAEYKYLYPSAEECATVIAKYLGPLNFLEDAAVASSANMDTDRAAVWYHNKNEFRDRMYQFDLKREELARFFGLPLWSGFASNRNSCSLVV